MTVIIVAPNPMPNCRRCGRVMDFFYLGLPLDKHIHDACRVEEFGEDMGRILQVFATALAKEKADEANSAPG